VIAACAALFGCEPGEQEIRLAAQDFRFSPPLVRVQHDRPARLTIVNEGREPHELAGPLLTDARVRLLSPPESLHMLPGRSVTVIFLAQPGAYAFRCRMRGHAGMEGMVIVES
jgi:plastocyanin